LKKRGGLIGRIISGYPSIALQSLSIDYSLQKKGYLQVKNQGQNAIGRDE
jgi:hypothetical protein